MYESIGKLRNKNRQRTVEER